MRSRLGRDALRMDKRVPADGPRAQQTADAALLAQIRDLNELNWAQRDEISRMQVAQEQQAGKLSKAEANVDRKIEMIQILRAQLDEADQRASSQAAAHAKSNEERMKMQEQLMPLQAQVEQIKKELESERKQKEDAWERMLNVDNQKLAELESKLEDERMNAREMLNELKSLRAEKDALAMERNARRDEAEMMRQSKQTLQGERIEALEQVPPANQTRMHGTAWSLHACLRQRTEAIVQTGAILAAGKFDAEHPNQEIVC